MEPQTRADQYQPKYRHFHPQDTVWVLNPFDHDVVWRTADENNQQSEFIIRARERAELPGGMIATLGLKTIVDELIQNSKEDSLSLYNLDVRAKYEKDVILRVKEAPASVRSASSGGPIDLSVKSEKKEAEVVEEKVEEKPFESVPVNPLYQKTETPPPIKNIAEASLGAKTQVVEE